MEKTKNSKKNVEGGAILKAERGKMKVELEKMIVEISVTHFLHLT